MVKGTNSHESHLKGKDDHKPEAEKKSGHMTYLLLSFVVSVFSDAVGRGDETRSFRGRSDSTSARAAIKNGLLYRGHDALHAFQIKTVSGKVEFHSIISAMKRKGLELAKPRLEHEDRKDKTGVVHRHAEGQRGTGSENVVTNSSCRVSTNGIKQSVARPGLIKT